MACGVLAPVSVQAEPGHFAQVLKIFNKIIQIVLSAFCYASQKSQPLISPHKFLILKMLTSSLNFMKYLII